MTPSTKSRGRNHDDESLDDVIWLKFKFSFRSKQLARNTWNDELMRIILRMKVLQILAEGNERVYTCNLHRHANKFLYLKDIGNQHFYCLYLLGILTEYLILYFGRFVAFSCWENVIKSSTVVCHFENKHLCHSIHYLTSLAG
jgi:hypothetical protein